MKERVRLLLRVRQGKASDSRLLRGEPSFAGSMPPGSFDNQAIARAAAISYFERRPDIDQIHLLDDEMGTLLEVIKR